MIRCTECGGEICTAGMKCSHCGFEVRKENGFTAWAPELAKSGNVGFKATYFETLARLEANNFWFRARNTLIIWALREYFPSFSSFMEIGCGTGFVLQAVALQFPTAKFIGADLFTQGLTFAASRVPGASFVQMDARRMPYVDEFDVAAAFDVIEHIEEDTEVLQGLHAAIKSGGGLLIAVPQHPWLWSSVDDYGCHVRRYTADELHNKIENAGFEIIRSTSFVTTLLIPMMVSRFLRKKGSRGIVDATAELKIPPWLNSLFFKMLSAEISLIRNGLSFPVGGSRLVVARKA
jgi:SAM-dependent methyltransferase